MRITLEWAGRATLLLLALTIRPTNYLVEFDPHPDNAAIVLIVTSAKTYRSVQRFDIDPKWSGISVRRPPLPPGRYTITAVLMRVSDTDPNGEEASLVVENIEEK